jgi:hypothetical protein
MPKKTHKARPIPEPARVGLKELINTEQLPSNDEQKKATLEIIKEIIDQGELYTATFEKLVFQEQSNSIQAQIIGLEQAILANAKRAQELGHDRDETLRKRIEQIKNLKTRLEEEARSSK